MQQNSTTRYLKLLSLALLFSLKAGYLFAQSCPQNNIGFNADENANALSVCAGTTGTVIQGQDPATTPTYSWEVASSISGPYTTVSSDVNDNEWTVSADYYNTAGTYYFRRVVSGSDACDGYSDTVELIVNPLPTLVGASQPGAVCEGLGAVINLTGMAASTTFSISYTINGGSVQTATGVTSDGSGNAGFTSIPLTASNNGQILQITQLVNTSTSPNCVQSFATDVTLSVNAIPATPVAGNDGPLCVGATLNLNTPLVSGAAYAWTGPNSFTATVQNPAVAGITLIDAGTYNVTVTVNGCTSTAGSTSVVINDNAVINLTSAGATTTQSLCINTAIADITYGIGGSGTGATVTGLPAGVNGVFNAGVFTISGTPSASGTFNYAVTTTGPCANPSSGGTLIVTANNTFALNSAIGTDAQTICINTSITNISYATTGATGATFSGLPAGVTGNWAGNVATISGTPTVSGTFNYSITLTGGCGNITATGTVTATANNTILLNSAIGTDAQTKCINTAVTNITYSTTGATSATFSGLPAGVTGNWAGNVATISGTPTASGTFNYTVTTTGGCTTPAVTASGTITVTANNTISLSSGAGTNNQTKCINIALTNITFTTTGATGATFSGLPTGVTGNWASDVVTISGTPTASGTFSYTVTTTGGCTTPAVTASGTITVTASNTITRTSTVGTDAQTKCINTAVTNITYSTTGATGATFSGLPAGVTGNWAGNVATISGTPTASGTFNYTVTTTGGCTTPAITATGTITVTANNTITLSSAAGTNAQTTCINTSIASITYATTGATGASFSGLPAGVTGNWAGNTVTISGTPTASGTFNYTVTTTGGCTTPAVTASGTITVTANNTVSLSSGAGTNNQTKCINIALTNITFATTGATGATFSGLPAGVNGNWAGNVVTINGTPTVSGTFNYTVTTTGGCTTPAVTASGTITVTASNTITRTSTVGTDAQTKCINTAVTNITYSTTGATGATFSGLPAGVTGNWAGNVATISGTPTASGTFNYTVTTTGGCTTPAITATGTITVTANNTIVLSSAVGTNAQTICIASAITNITYSTTGATGASFSGLPAGVSGNWAGNSVTVSGTPTTSGAFNYTITLTGGCGNITATGSININTPPAATGVTICQGGTGSLSSAAACAASIPASSGPNFPGTGATSGSGTAWTNPGNVLLNDNVNATVSLGFLSTSRLITATNFGFSIPANATINGVQVSIGRSASNTNSIADDELRLIVGGISVGADRGVGTSWPTTETIASYGSAADLWGTTLTPAQLNASNFGVGLGVANSTFSTRTGIVDYFQITVSYTIPGSLNWYTVSSGGTAIGSNSPFNPVGVAGSGLPNTNTPATTVFYAECAAAPGCRTAVNYLINPSPTITGNLNVCIGLTSALTGNGTPAASAPWVSSNTSVATVNATGVVTGVAAGTSVITYTNNNGCSVTATVTVSAPAISGTLNVCIGFTRTLTGNGTPAASNPWISSNTAVATVNASGVVTGIAPGTTNITYTNNVGCSVTAPFTVNPLPVVSITGVTSICAGGPNSTTTLSPTTGGTWLSSSNSIATVTNGGVVTGVAAGTATFTFTQTSTGCSSTTASVTVTARPVATFTTNPGANVCVNTNVTYTTQAGQSGYAWSVPGVAGTNYTIISGGISSTDNTVTLQWLTAGSKTVTVNYSNSNGCTAASAASNTTTANARPTPTFTTAPGAFVCAIANVTYTTQTGQSNYIWSVPGTAGIDYTITAGGTGTGSNTVTLQWLTTGSKTVTVNYTNASGCTALAAASNTTTVNARPVANVITGPNAVCVGSTITLTSNATGTPTLTYTWASGNGNATVTNAGVLTGVAAGTSNITYTVTDGNTCTATSPAYSVTINARPTPTISLAPGSPICTNLNITYTTQPSMTNYTWTVPGVAGTDYTLISGGTSTDNSVTVQWLTTGGKNVTVNYTNGNGCNAASAGTSSTTVNARPTPTFTAQPGTAVCASNGVNTTNVVYTTQGGQSNYIWSVPGTAGVDYTITAGGIGTGSNTVTLQWLTTGSKTVTVNYNNASGCNSLTAVSNTTTVNALPVVNTSAAAVCVNSTITATPNSGGTWISSNNTIATITNAGLITGVSAGTVTFTYTLTATGCSRTTGTVTVNALPVVAAINGSATAICVNDIALFTDATSGGSWSITNGTGTASVDAGGLVTGLSSGSVTLVYTYSNGTCTNTATLPLTINPIPVVAPIAGGAAAVCVNASTPAFTNTTAGGTWSIINGSGSASVTAGGVVTGITAGSVTVVYSVDNGTCSSEDAVSLTVNTLPAVASIGGGALSVCVNATTPAFTNTTAGGVWSIINGTGTASITAGGIVTGLSAGTVNVAYTINNGTCSNTATKTLTISALPVIAAIGGGSATVCINSTTPAFTNATAGGVWSIINVTGTASISVGGVVTGLTAGTVTVVYSVDNGTCSNAVNTTLTVNALPTAGIITGSNAVCAGSTINLNSNASGTGSLTYTWFSANTATATVINTGVVTGVAGGTSNITYTVGDGNNCSATSPVFTVTVRARPSATITSSNTAICDGSSISVTGNVIANGAWTLTLSNGSVATGTGNGSFNISLSPVATATYTIAALADANCTSIAADFTGSTVVTVNEPVVITTQPALSQTGCSGSSINFTVAATGTGLTYQWRKGVTALTNGGSISGATSATLVINPLVAGDAAADYNVVITGAAPCGSVTSGNAALLVNQAVAITTQPVTQTLCSGNDVSFTVVATGSGLSYQWRKNGSPLSDGGNISGANSVTLTITNLTSADAANYTVVITGLTPCTPVTSAIATLTVNTAVFITSQPADEAVCATLPVTFTVAATGAGLTYQWYKGTFPGTPVTNNANISGAATASLHFNQANIGNIGDYYVVITGLAPCTSVQSDYAHLAVDQTITITQQPTAQVVCTGSDAQFVVVASAGVDPLLYQWRKNGIDIPGANSDTLNIIAATAGDAANYSVEITGIAGCITSFSSVVSLTVNPLSVGGTVNASTAVCSSTNSGTLTLTGKTGNVIRWEYSTDGGGTWAPIVNTTTTQNYTNLSVETMYRAVVQSGVCAPDNSVPATISFHPVPDASATPVSQTVCSGAAITTIVLSGTVPSTTYTWTRNNNATVTGIASSGSGNIGGTLTNTSLSQVTVTFTITPTANGCPGTPVTATVVVDPSPDAIPTPSSQTICSGTAITTIVLTSSVPSTTFTWTRNSNVTVTGIAASGSGDISGTLTNNTNAPVTVTFTITPTAAGCSPGAPVTATVLVNPTPNAVALPSSQTVCSGVSINSIALNSAVSGTTYNWTRDNNASVTGIASGGSGNIAGILTNTTLAAQTVTFTITPTANTCPGASITATVLVNPAPDAVATPSSQTTCSAITAIMLSGTVPSTVYTWTRNNNITVTGIAASGSGNISGSLTNNTNAPITVTFTITPTANTCPGTPITATVLVNPAPNAVATPSSQTLCSAVPLTTIALTGSVAGTAFDWTRNNTGTVTGIAANGTGDISGTLTNTSNALVTVTFTITPTINGCPGAPVTATAGIKPTPTVSATNSTQTVCSGIAIATSTIANPNAVTGTTFSWTRDNTVNLTGIAASGSGNISGTLNNTTSTQQVTVFTVTAIAGGCSSTTTVTVTVNPKPAMTSAATAKVCNNSTVSIPLTSNIASSYTWIAANNANTTGESITLQSTSTLSNTLTNTSTISQFTPRQNVLYTVIPTSTATGCAGTPQTVTVTVNPPYNVSFFEYPTDDNGFVICDGDLVGGGGQNDIDLIEGEYAGGTLLWQYATGSSAGPWNAMVGPHFNNLLHDTLPDPPSIFSPMGAYYFRILVDGCPSDTITMTKTSTLTIAAGGPNNTVCETGSPSAITLSGSTVGGTASTTVGGTWSITSLNPANGANTGTLSSTAFRTPAQIPTVTYTPPANYSGVVTLTLTSNDPDGSGPCAPLTETRTITVSQAPIISNAASMYICSGSNTNIALTSVIPSTYTWTVGTITGGITGASAGSGNNINQVLTNPSTAVAGTVQYIVTPTPISAATCAAVTASIVVTVTPPPSVSLTRSPATICQGQTSTLTATNSGGTNSLVYSGTSGPVNLAIPDDNINGLSSTIGLIGSGGLTLAATDLIQVTLNITHTYDDDLDIFLVDPSGTKAMLLSSDNGGSNNNYTNTVLRTDVANVIGSAGNNTPPFTGTYRPEGTITTAPGVYTNIPNAALLGAQVDGTWTLRLFDDSGLDLGTLGNWSLSITKQGVYTSVFNGPATIGAVGYSGAANTTATAVVTPPVGPNSYTVTTTDGAGCSNTSVAAIVTVNPPPTLTGATQQATVCAGSSAQINLTGLVAGSTSTVTYKINSGSTQTIVGVVADAAGNASFNTIALTSANNGQVLQVTSLTATSATPSCSQLFTQNVTLSVNSTPTLTGAALQAAVCPGSSAQINLTGLVAGSTATISYTINAGPTQTATGVVANAGGNASFNTIPLTVVNNGQTLQVTGVTITSATPNCAQAFTRNVTLNVNATPVLSSSLTPAAICSAATFTYTATSATAGASFGWTRAAVPGISQAASGGSGNVSEVLTNTSNAPVSVTYVYTTSANSCNNAPGQNVVVIVNPTPTLATVTQAATVCAGAGAIINLTGLLPNTTTTISYTINNIGQPAITGVVSDASGNASFTSTNLTLANNGQLLKVTGLATTSYTPGCVKTVSVLTLLSVNAIPTLSGATQAAAICVSGSAVINLSGLVANSTNNTINYSINSVAQIPVTGVNANASGNASFSTSLLTAANNGQTLTITGITNGTCSQSFTQNVTLSVGSTNTWLGINTNWFDVQNWCSGAIPTSATDVVIPGSLANYPLLNAGTGSVRNINIQNTASVTVSGAKLQVAGVITNTGSFNTVLGTIELNGAAAQTFSGSLFVGKIINGLVISNPAGVTVSNAINDTLNITDSLAFGNVNNSSLNTGNNITLVSRANKTARVADITNGGANSGNSFTGKVIVERYIPERRSWRMLTVPIQSSGAPTFNASWQEGVVNPDFVFGNRLDPHPGFGMHISGASVALGFDPTPNNNPSIKYYNPVTFNWLGIPNTLSAKVTDSAGYMVFVRGDRNTPVYLNTAAPISNTILRAAGQLKTNNQTSTVPAGVGPYTVVGNPYPSSIDLRKITTSGAINGANYVVWDPALTGVTGVGAYQYFTRSGGPGSDYLVFPGNSGAGGGSYGAALSVNNTLQSSQAFMVQNAGAGSVSINENAKIGGSSSNVFRPSGEPAVRPSLGYISTLFIAENNDSTTQLVDGALSLYNPDYADAVDIDDAKKLLNFSSENFGIDNGNEWLQIEKRTALNEADTIQYKMRFVKVKSYQLQVSVSNINRPGLTAFLEDKYLKTFTALDLGGTIVYHFAITADSGAWNPARFRIVLRSLVALPVTISTVKAYKNNSYINVDWNTEHESAIQQYDVEKSADGVHFTKAYTETNVLNNDRSKAYRWIDPNPIKGMNYYRIRSKGLDGTNKVSVIVKVMFDKLDSYITLYPNPVTDGNLNLYFVNQPSGEYLVRLLSNTGQLIASKKVAHSQSTTAEPFKTEQALLHGSYLLEIFKADGTKQTISVLY